MACCCCHQSKGDIAGIKNYGKGRWPVWKTLEKSEAGSRQSRYMESYWKELGWARHFGGARYQGISRAELWDEARKLETQVWCLPCWVLWWPWMFLQKRNNYLWSNIFLRESCPSNSHHDARPFICCLYIWLLPWYLNWEWLSPCNSIFMPFNGTTMYSKYLPCPSSKPSLVSTARVYEDLSSQPCMRHVCWVEGSGFMLGTVIFSRNFCSQGISSTF
jgi:hypothetical protein